MCDGDHRGDNQYQGLLQALDVLADKAIIFIDDSAFQDKAHVWDGINKLLEKDNRVSFVREFIPTQKNHKEGMWQGFVALKFER